MKMEVPIQKSFSSGHRSPSASGLVSGLALKTSPSTDGSSTISRTWTTSTHDQSTETMKQNRRPHTYSVIHSTGTGPNFARLIASLRRRSEPQHSWQFSRPERKTINFTHRWSIMIQISRLAGQSGYTFHASLINQDKNSLLNQWISKPLKPPHNAT